MGKIPEETCARCGETSSIIEMKQRASDEQWVHSKSNCADDSNALEQALEQPAEVGSEVTDAASVEVVPPADPAPVTPSKKEKAQQ